MRNNYINPFESKISNEKLITMATMNKYFKTVLTSYYKLTRGKTIMDSIKDMKKPGMLEQLVPEYVDFLSGRDVKVSINEDDMAFEGHKTFHIPNNVFKRDMASFLQDLQKLNSQFKHNEIF